MRVSIRDGSLLLSPEDGGDYRVLKALIGQPLRWGSVAAVPEGITTGAVLGDTDVLGHVAVGEVSPLSAIEGAA